MVRLDKLQAWWVQHIQLLALELDMELGTELELDTEGGTVSEGVQLEDRQEVWWDKLQVW